VNAIDLLNSGRPLLSSLLPSSGQICENSVAITTARQAGDFRRQPLDRHKTPSPTLIGDYRVFFDSVRGTVSAYLARLSATRNLMLTDLSEFGCDLNQSEQDRLERYNASRACCMLYAGQLGGGTDMSGNEQYYLLRAQRELDMATQAKDPIVIKLHLDMAARYAALRELADAETLNAEDCSDN
jgi:hypothetical protein